MKTIVLLVSSNIFIMVALFDHLKIKTLPLVIAILASWAIALAEYIFKFRRIASVRKSSH